jgi:hypothetical protein
MKYNRQIKIRKIEFKKAAHNLRSNIFSFFFIYSQIV